MFHNVSTGKEIDEVVKIAREIWREHYPPIIGIEQVEYILENFHSKHAITVEITLDNYAYYLIKNNSDSIAAYYRLGFIKTDDICVDIGGGYKMDDIQMELSIR